MRTPHAIRTEPLVERAGSIIGESGWRQIVLGAGQIALDSAFASEHDGPIVAVVERLRKAGDVAGANELEHARLSLINEVLDFGVPVGYALARTWPSRPEDFDEWPQRAIAYAGLPSEEPEVRSPEAPEASDTLEAATVRFNGPSGSTRERLVAGSTQLWSESRYQASEDALERFADMLGAKANRHELISKTEIDHLEEESFNLRGEARAFGVLFGYEYARAEGLPEADRLRRALAFALRADVGGNPEVRK